MLIKSHDDNIFAHMGNRTIGKSIYPIYLGIELEINVKTSSEDLSSKAKKDLVRENFAKKVEPLTKDFAFFKHDGSMENGFEVVTLPMTIEEHKKRWSPVLKFLDKEKENIRLYERTGMHIHISRSPLSNLQIGKMMYIVNNLSSGLISKIAGRQLTSYCKPLKVGTFNWKSYSYDRYVAFNTKNPKTVELRIFATTLARKRFAANIEFCDALVGLTWPGNVGMSEIKKSPDAALCNYIEANKYKFPNLNKVITGGL